MIAESIQRQHATTSPTIGVEADCAHCGLPVPAGLRRRGEPHQFCCHGCDAAFKIIHTCGLERYYTIRDHHDAATPAAVRATAKRYSEFDDPVFSTLYCRPLADSGSLRTCELYLENIHCAACVWLVEKLPAVVPGVIEARLDLRRSLIQLTWDQGAVPLSRIARTLDNLGYPPHPARDANARDARQRADRQALVRIGVAGACAGNVMLLALALYAGMFNTMEPQHRQLFRWVSMALTLLSLGWPGSLFFRGAWAAIRTRTLHLDLPIAIGLGAGAAWGTLNTIAGRGEIYFDSLSILVLVLLVGRWIQGRQQRWAADAVELLFSLTPTSARLVDHDERGIETVRDVPIEAVPAGAVVEIRAGDSVPVDGVVVTGASSIDQALLTGESRPIEVAPGDTVAAGAVNLAARLRVRVVATGADTRVGRLMRMVEDGARRRAPIVRLADRISGWFVACMLATASLTLGLWLWLNPAVALDNATAVLIVTCPCALGLTTPLAMTIAVGRAARRGILVKGGDALERLAHRGTVFLDKTGTLTQGRLSVVRWLGDTSVKPLVAALESLSSHPIAVALTRELGTRGDWLPATATQTTGGGIEGLVGTRRVLVGSPAFVAARVDAQARWSAAAHEIANDGLTPVLIAVDGTVVAALGLGDALRPDAAAAVKCLRDAGWKVRVLSGDHPGVVANVAMRLGIEPAAAHGGVTPEGKLAAVIAAGHQSRGPVVMVGDGVNDAAALAAASVGIAVHGGAEASLAAADVYLSRPGLASIADLLVASRRTMAVIRRGLVASLLYNAVAASLAVTGVINPLIAAILMPASSLTVLALSVRSRTFDREERRS